MESIVAVPHAAQCSRGYYEDSHKFPAQAPAIAEGEGCEAAEEEDEEEEEEQDEEEEEEEVDDDFYEAAQEDQTHAPNKELDAPACALAVAPPTLGQLQPQQPVQRCAKRSRPSTAKERISKMPPCAAGKRSSIYRGVTRHRWTGRYEAHLWDKSTWNQNQNKKGKQVYLGAYDDEEAAARAYDLAALKYWGPGTLINFPVSDYARDIKEMQSLTREDYLGSLRRKSSGFSRGGAKMKGGVSRHHPNARWDVQAGRTFASTLPHLGGYVTIGDGGAGRPSQEYGALGCSTSMINLCHFMNWLQPPNLGSEAPSHNLLKKSCKPMEEEHLLQEHNLSPTYGQEYSYGTNEQEEKYGAKLWQCYEPYQLPSLGLCGGEIKAGLPALTALSQSSMFTKMEERLNAGKGQESATRGVCESAADALAAALAMDDCLSSPLGEEAEKTSCPIDHSCPTSFVDVHPTPALSFPALPFEMDHPAYLSDQVPGLWNAFETPLSSLSMGMTLQ